MDSLIPTQKEEKPPKSRPNDPQRYEGHSLAKRILEKEAEERQQRVNETAGESVFSSIIHFCLAQVGSSPLITVMCG